MDGTQPTESATADSSVEAARTVLVIDDSRAHRRLLARTLESWGYRIVEAGTGEEGLDILGEREIPIIISDWMMPGMTGAEFCRAFRAAYPDRSACVILLTAQTDRETLAEGLESGADDFLSKPFSAVELKARIRAGERIIEAQEAVQRKNAELTETLDELRVAYASIDRDLRQARAFQQSLVPERHVLLDGIELNILYTPSGHVGGDLVGYFPVSEGRFGVFSADVSGHGVASALMTARVAAHLSMASPEQNIALTRRGDRYEMRAPADICETLNMLVLGDAESDLYLTMAFADVDLGEGCVRLAQAGHPSPLLFTSGQNSRFVSSFGMPIGLVADAEFSEFSVPFRPGDRLFLYSDGLTECPDPDGALFEEERLRAFFDGGDCLQDLERRLHDFAQTDQLPDDLSAVMITAR